MTAVITLVTEESKKKAAIPRSALNSKTTTIVQESDEPGCPIFEVYLLLFPVLSFEY